MAPFTSPAPALVRSAVSSTDSELVASVRRGDPSAFEEIYGRYHLRIAAYVTGMVGDRGRAEEVTQDVFVSALRRMRDTERPIAFKPWIYEIAKNACIDHFRRSRRAQEISIDAHDGAGAAEHVMRVPAPEVAVERKQSLEDLLGAFGGLSRTHHRILVMRELEGLSYQEIGARLEMSRPAVESTLFRARRRLGEEYQELATGARCVRVQDIIATVGGTAPGARDRRRLGVHLSHCQPCRRHAAGAGLQVAALAPRSITKKVAALIPLPGFLSRRLSGEGQSPRTATPSGAALARWSTQVGPALEPAMGTWGRAAVAAVAVAAAGVAGGTAVGEIGSTPAPAPQAAGRGSVVPPGAAAAPSGAAAASSGAAAASSGIAPSTATGSSGRPASRSGSATAGRPGARRAGSAPLPSAAAAGSVAPSGAGGGAVGGAPAPGTSTGRTPAGGRTTGGEPGGGRLVAGAGRVPIVATVNVPATKVSAGRIPVAKVPTVKVPAVKVPKVKVPTVKVPAVVVPGVNVPAVKVPAAKVPPAEIPPVTSGAGVPGVPSVAPAGGVVPGAPKPLGGLVPAAPPAVPKAPSVPAIPKASSVPVAPGGVNVPAAAPAVPVSPAPAIPPPVVSAVPLGGAQGLPGG